MMRRFAGARTESRVTALRGEESAYMNDEHARHVVAILRSPRGSSIAQMAHQPLSTGTIAPFTLLAASEARKTMTDANSFAWATRPTLAV